MSTEGPHRESELGDYDAFDSAPGGTRRASQPSVGDFRRLRAAVERARTSSRSTSGGISGTVGAAEQARRR
jgi:hypothetical protein